MTSLLRLPLRQPDALRLASELRDLQTRGPVHLAITPREGGHLGFGHGARYCSGVPLARIERQAAFSRLRHRFPAMPLAVPLQDLQLRAATVTGGLVDLPVTW